VTPPKPACRTMPRRPPTVAGAIERAILDAAGPPCLQRCGGSTKRCLSRQLHRSGTDVLVASGVRYRLRNPCQRQRSRVACGRSRDGSVMIVRRRPCQTIAESVQSVLPLQGATLWVPWTPSAVVTTISRSRLRWSHTKPPERPLRNCLLTVQF